VDEPFVVKLMLHPIKLFGYKGKGSYTLESRFYSMIFIQKEIRSFSPVCFYTVTQDDKNYKKRNLKKTGVLLSGELISSIMSAERSSTGRTARRGGSFDYPVFFEFSLIVCILG